MSEASFYIEASKPVAFILDLMKLNVPDLFASPVTPPHNTTSGRFQKTLHTYISSNGLLRDLLKNVDKIMVRSDHVFLHVSQCHTFYPLAAILGWNI